MENIDIGIIRKIMNARQISWSQHMLIRMSQRGVKISDVENAIMTGEIVEKYYEDYPHPSCLIMGLSDRKDAIHVVCGVGDDKLWMITTYYPSKDEWMEDLKTRRRL